MEQPRGEQPALLSDQLPGGGCHDDFSCRVSGAPSGHWWGQFGGA